jgi:prepilin peptidase dependent protein B
MRHHQRGLSIVELMVGLALGLIVVAAALLALTHHLRESRSLLIEARLMQDLRTTTDLIGRDLLRAGPLSLAGGGLRFNYPGTDEELAYRLHDGVIEMQIGEGHWQAMTDANTLRVSSFGITPRMQEIVLDGFCSQPCAEGSTSCPPRQELRSLAIHVEARATADAAVTRSVQTLVRLRNDALAGACPA